MSASLESAYGQAWYHFWWPGGYERLSPGQFPVRLLEHIGSPEANWCWITAANPHSRILPQEINRLRNLLLKLALQQHGLMPAPAWSGSCTGDWPVEPGFWLVPHTLEPVMELGKAFEQHALLWGNRDTPASLLWLQT